jgi:glycosyltransferase involved in cell wall biosynthesis
MIVPKDLVFARDWLSVAREVADVQPVVLGDGRSPMSQAIHVAPLRLRPSRIFGRINAAVTARRLVQAVRATPSRPPVEFLHTHFFSSAAPVRIAARRLGIAYAITEHSSRITGHSAWHKPFTRRGRRLARLAYRDAEVVIAVTHYLAQQVRAIQPAANVCVIGNPVDVETFSPVERKRDGTALVSVGRLESDKRMDLAIEAFAILAARRNGLSLTIIGDGPDRISLEDRIRELGLSDAVRLLGRLPRAEVATYVARSHVFVLASTVETFCIAAAEAAAAGVPVVMADVPAVREWLTPRLGRLVSNPTAETLSAALEQVIADLHRFDADEMRDTIACRFGPPVIAERLASVYDEIGRRGQR